MVVKGEKRQRIAMNWERGRLVNREQCEQLFEQCSQAGEARVTAVSQKETYKRRPVPLNTTEAQKLISRKLGISPAKSMEAMEKLYTRGLLSYPRTDTNKYGPNIPLKSLVANFEADLKVGEFAGKLLKGGAWGGPRSGSKDDKAHPPIHPVRLPLSEDFHTPNEEKIFELLLRHFLASLARDAVGSEVKVEVALGSESFTTSGIQVIQSNYLEIYDTWAEKKLPAFEVDDPVNLASLTLEEGKTSPPSPLTDSDLISLMEEHGIGTDATIHEHIQTIFTRGYAVKKGVHIQPTPLGEALVDVYQHLDIGLAKPDIRANTEADIASICEGTKQKDEVLETHLKKMRGVYGTVAKNSKQLQKKFAELMGNPDFVPVRGPVAPLPRKKAAKVLGSDSAPVACPGCKVGHQVVRKAKTFFVACDRFPKCRFTQPIPSEGVNTEEGSYSNSQPESNSIDLPKKE